MIFLDNFSNFLFPNVTNWQRRVAYGIRYYVLNEIKLYTEQGERAVISKENTKRNEVR